ncbi:MAG: sensor histidine kinase [Candidatus Geothermincolia bacterium]
MTTGSEVVRVLTVEDDPEEAELTRRFLEKRMNVLVEKAGDAATARRKLATADFDVVLVDTVDMNDLEFGLLEEIAALDKGFAVVVVTGKGDERLAAKSLEVGASGYVIKNNNMPQALVSAIENAIMDRSLKRAEALFNMQQAITEAALNTLNEIFFAVDLDGAFIKWNKELCAVTGYQDDDFCTMHLSDIMDPADNERVQRLTMRTGSVEASTFDMAIISRSGLRHSYEINARAFKATGDAVAGLVFLGHDVSETRRRSEMLARENEELDDFAQTVSHDLKRPLSAIMLAAETLKLILSTPCSPRTERPVDIVNEMTKIITDECEMASSMISSMLQLAEESQVSQRLSPVDLREVVESVVEELEDARTCERVEVRIDPDLGTVRADATHIYRLFANLIGNAVQHGATESPVIEVKKLASEEGVLCFLVRDNGPGIPEKLLPYIFRPFFKSGSGGTGLGLTTASKMLKIYGGTIRAYNDNGACFEFTLRQ